MALPSGNLKWNLDSLYVESATRVLRFRPWPEPGAWAGLSTTHCQTRFDARLGLADFESARKRKKGYEARAIDCFFVRLPAHVREAVRPFPTGLFELLRLIYDAEEPALELLSSNPALGFAVAVSAQLKTEVGASGWKTPVELVRMKRTEISRWLELPGGKSTVKLLGRLSMGALQVPHLRTLRSLLVQNDPVVQKRLRHMEQISPEALALLASSALDDLGSAKVVAEAGAMKTRGIYLTPRIETYLENHARLHPKKRAPKIESLEQFDLLERDQKAGLEEEFKIQVKARMRFPEPPVPGNDNIVPLQNAMELAREAEFQGNCVEKYFGCIRMGDCYLYRMELPERCTLSLGRTSRGWVLREIRTANNNLPAKAATMRVVSRWLRDHGLQLRRRLVG